jgi:hypothetical protein
MKYICLKICTGEEIVGLTESDPQTDEFINVEDPVKVNHALDPEGNFGIRFSHFMPFSEERLFTFKRKDVILYSKPTTGLIKYYDEYFKNSHEEDPFEDEEWIHSIPMTSFSKH